MMIIRWCTVQTNDLQAKTYPTICTHHKLYNNNENKFPVFPERICNKWQIGCNKHPRHTTTEKYGDNGKYDNNVPLNDWGRVMHICVNELSSIIADNWLSPEWRQAIIWTNARILLIGLIATNLSKILIDVQTFSFKKINFSMLSGKWWPYCLDLNILKICTEVDISFCCGLVPVEIACDATLQNVGKYASLININTAN